MQQEQCMQQGGSAARELAKQRRAALKEVLKAVTDSSAPLQQRLRLLQARYVAALQQQVQHDKQLCDLQDRLEQERREAEAGRSELARAQQKVDTLEKLARGLSAENKALRDDAHSFKQQNAKVQEVLKGVQETIQNQQLETHKAIDERCLLATENAQLKAQLQRTQEVVEDLSTTHKDRLADLADKLAQQNDAMAQANKLHAALDAVMKENEALTLKAALADTFKERNGVLEKALTEAQAQSGQHKSQMQEMQASLTRATKMFKSFDKLQKTMTEQQQLTAQLMQERQAQQQQVQQLQDSGRELADRLRRTQLQKQRLEALCRTLQGRAGDGAAGETTATIGSTAGDSDADSIVIVAAAGSDGAAAEDQAAADQAVVGATRETGC